MESEKVIERKLRARVKKEGGWCLKMVVLHTSGLPDRLCLFPRGIVVFVELKGTKLKQSKIQVYVQGKLRRMGFDCRVIDSSNGIDELIEDVKRK